MKIFKRIIAAVLLVITFALVFIFVITRIQGETPTLFGYQLLRVVSPSMEPELKVGDIILAKNVDDITTIEVGDIITYHGEFGDYAGKLITHEVIVPPYEAAGEYYLQTQGIANYYADPEISASQVQGKMVCTLPVFSAIYGFFMTPWGLIVVLGFLAILFINEVFSLIKVSKEKEITDSADVADKAEDVFLSADSSSAKDKTDLTK